MKRVSKHEPSRARSWVGVFAVFGALGAGPARGADGGVSAPPSPAAVLVNGAPSDAARAAEEMGQAADAFWAALSPEQQAKAAFDMKDEQRLDWHYIPKPRKGLPFKEMNSAQRDLAHALLASGMSSRGYATAMTIMSLDQVLKDIETKGPVRDPELYYFSIFGKPTPTGAWGWRVEGHHLSMNFTIVGGKAIACGPAFMGANPANVLDGPRKGLRALAAEEDMGRLLIKALKDEQRTKCVFADAAPKEVITGNARKAEMVASGLAAGDMTADQKQLLNQLVKHYAHRLRGELAAEELRRIDRAGADKVQFAWAGGADVGQPHYYRIQGPTFLVEYDDTQNNANHIHTVWRDMENDFGGDALRKHYEQQPHE